MKMSFSELIAHRETSSQMAMIKGDTRIQLKDQEYIDADTSLPLYDATYITMEGEVLLTVRNLIQAAFDIHDSIPLLTA